MNNVLLVSLKADEAKHITRVLSNPTAKKILDYLSTHSKATETSLAKKLRLPLSTVHYTLAQLTKGKLVSVDEFHYSQKGREVNHYSLASQMIIITPQPMWDIKEKLQAALPFTTLAALVAYGIQRFYGVLPVAEFVQQRRFADIRTSDHRNPRLSPAFEKIAVQNLCELTAFADRNQKLACHLPSLPQFRIDRDRGFSEPASDLGGNRTASEPGMSLA